MKTLIKWFVKKYVSKEAIKEYIHSANASLREKVAVGDGKQKIVEVGNDVAEVVGVYLSVYADDGKITDDAEEAKVNAACDVAIDKYVSDEVIDALLNKIIG